MLEIRKENLEDEKEKIRNDNEKLKKEQIILQEVLESESTEHMTAEIDAESLKEKLDFLKLIWQQVMSLKFKWKFIIF